MPKPLQMGARKNLDRAEAVEQYIILRLRTEDINRLDFLVHAFYENRIGLPGDSPYSAADLKDTVRTAALGWFATLTDKQPKAVYAFDCLFVLFPHLTGRILKVRTSLGAVEAKLHQFRNNVAFHARSDVSVSAELKRSQFSRFKWSHFAPPAVRMHTSALAATWKRQQSQLRVLQRELSVHTCSSRAVHSSPFCGIPVASVLVSTD